MIILKKSSDVALTLLLLVLMTITRGRLLEPVASFPNATLAIFFIAGIYLREFIYPPLFFLAAGLIDYFAIQNGVSGWCVTPAYLFLIPAYLALWFGGRTFKSLDVRSARTAFSAAGVLLISSTLSFLISNGSFYLLSGYFKEPSFAEYAFRTAKYYPGYIGPVFIYVAVAAIALKAGIALAQAANRLGSARA